MARYSPGGWHGVATPAGVALLADVVPVEVLDGVWSALSDGRGLAAVLEGLVAAFGTDFTAIPSFALATGSADELRVTVRGAIEVTVADGSGVVSATVSGLGVTTWTEQVFRDVSAVELRVPGSTALALPINDGVVGAGAIGWVLGGEADVPGPARVPATRAAVVAGPAAEPAPEVPAEPEPEFTLPPAESLTATFTDGAEDAIDDAVDAVSDYDRLLYGDTQYSSVEDAAVRDSAPRPGELIGSVPRAPVPAPAERLGDHDGETISAEQAAALLAAAGAAVSDATGGASPSDSLVSSVPRVTVAASLVAPDGTRYLLDRGAVVGRRPGLARVDGARAPHLIVVPSPTQDVSRNHVELRIEGTRVLAIDLKTTNGTRLLRVGQEPVRLHPGEATLLVAGDRLDVGDGNVLAFEGLA